MKNRKIILLFLILLLYFIFLQIEVLMPLYNLGYEIYLSVFLFMLLVSKRIIKNPILAIFLGLVTDLLQNTFIIGSTSFIFLLYMHFYKFKHRLFSRIIADLVFYTAVSLNLSFSNFSIKFMIQLLISFAIYKAFSRLVK